MCCWSKTHPFEQRIGTSDFLLPNLCSREGEETLAADISPHYQIWSSSYPHWAFTEAESAMVHAKDLSTLELYLPVSLNLWPISKTAWHSFIGQTDLRLECAHCQSLLHELKDCNSLGLIFCWRFVGGRQVMHFLPQEGEK